MKLAWLLLVAACYEHEMTPYVGPTAITARTGQVAMVAEVAHTPAVPTSGTLLGGMVFGSGGGATAMGNGFVAPGSPYRHAFQVTVAFDNGQTGVFIYQDWSPFRPGDHVLLTPQGLVNR
jgi:hypothetical protein